MLKPQASFVKNLQKLTPLLWIRKTIQRQRRQLPTRYFGALELSINVYPLHQFNRVIMHNPVLCQNLWQDWSLCTSPGCLKIPYIIALIWCVTHAFHQNQFCWIADARSLHIEIISAWLMLNRFKLVQGVNWKKFCHAKGRNCQKTV